MAERMQWGKMMEEQKSLLPRSPTSSSLRLQEQGHGQTGTQGHGDREPFPGRLSQPGPTALPANP